MDCNSSNSNLSFSLFWFSTWFNCWIIPHHLLNYIDFEVEKLNFKWDVVTRHSWIQKYSTTLFHYHSLHVIFPILLTLRSKLSWDSEGYLMNEIQKQNEHKLNLNSVDLLFNHQVSLLLWWIYILWDRLEQVVCDYFIN